MLTPLGTTPLGSSAPIIVAVGMQNVAKGAERMPVFVVASRQVDIGVLVRRMGRDIDHAQGPGVPDCIEASLLAGPCVGDDLSDLEPGETCLEIGKVAWEEGRIIPGVRATGSGQYPVGGQFGVEELTGVAVVPVDHAGRAGSPLLGSDRRIGTGPGSLVVARIDDEARFRITGCGVSTHGRTRLGVAVTPLLPLALGRTRTGRRLVAVGFHA
jgi:hypothetical protein